MNMAYMIIFLSLCTPSIEYITKNEELLRLESQDEVIDFPLFLQDGLRVDFSLSTKGNGILNIKGEYIHVYDSHDDGNIYENRWSNLVRIDLSCFDVWINSYTQIKTNEEEYYIPTKEKVVEIWGDFLFFNKLIPIFTKRYSG